MNQFPDSCRPECIDFFEATLETIWLEKLRKKIYLFLLLNRQNDFFDIELFDRNYVKNIKWTEKMIHVIIAELESMGWKTYLGYGGTGLFIYDKERPSSAW